MHRQFNERNGTVPIGYWYYAIETGLHEYLAQSPHRTLDPEVRYCALLVLHSGAISFGGAARAVVPWAHTLGRHCLHRTCGRKRV